MTGGTITWTDDAVAHEVPGCYVFDRWGRQFVAHEDIGICCCIACHGQRYGDPIGSREAIGWDGAELGDCPTCQRLADVAALPLGGEEESAVRVSPSGMLLRAHTRGGHIAARHVTELNPSLEKLWPRW